MQDFPGLDFETWEIPALIKPSANPPGAFLI
jgi:hypothetical protein